MAEKNVKTRIIHKHDTEENWNKATNFIPKQGEIIVYDNDSIYDYERFKIGDGVTNVNDLPFATYKTVVDAELSATSENPVQNKVIKAALDKKIDEPSANGLVRKFMSGMYGAMGVDTTMPDSPTNADVPTTKLLKDYVENNTSNPLKLSDTNLQKTGLIAQSYQAAGSTPGTVGATTYSVVTRDTATLDDSISGAGKIPSSYAVGEYVKGVVAYKVDKIEGKGLSTNDYTDEDKAEVAKIANKVDKPSQKGILSNESAVGVITLVKSTTMPEEPSDYMIPTTKLLKDYVGDKSNPLQLSDTDKTKEMVLIQHNYDSETSTEKYIGRSIDVNNLSESGLAAYNIPTSKAVISWVKAYIESLNQSGGA